MDTKMRLIIIGGVAGGASAAARSRRLSEDAEIIMIERTPYVSFANCGLPYHIGGAIPQRRNLLVQTPESLKERYNIDVRINTEAISVNRDKKIVSVKNLQTGAVDEISYDKLILAPGAESFRPPLPGIDLPSVFTLQTLADMDAIINSLNKNTLHHAAVIGGGFIGLEAAENLAQKGMAVSIIEADRQVMPPIDPEMAELVHRELKIRGIDLHLGRTAQSFALESEKTIISFKDGGKLETGMVLLAIGVRPRTKLARDAGLSIGQTGGILVDDRLLTSDPDIYAVGDAIEVKNPLTGMPAYIPLAGPANRQGRIAADQVFGRDSRYRGTVGASICKVFDLSVGAVGYSEKVLKKLGIKYQKSITHSGNHASYYPGAYPIAIKLLFNSENGAILGAQAIGMEGVDKRIDVLSTAIAARFTVFDLEHAELAYAPQYGSAKDPVNMAGFVAANIMRGDHRQVHPEDLAGIDHNSTLLLDVRTPGEYKYGHIQGSINIPLNELRLRANELPKEKKIIVYCQVGLRGYIAQRMLTLMGFDAVNLDGGYKTWLMSGGK